MGEIIRGPWKREHVEEAALRNAEALKSTAQERLTPSEEFERHWLLNALSEDIWTARHESEDLLAKATPAEIAAAGAMKNDVRRRKLLPDMFGDIKSPADQLTEESKIERLATAMLFLELTDLTELN